MIAPDVGGGFGSKLNVYAEEALALTLARVTGRPVKWIEERQRELRRHDPWPGRHARLHARRAREDGKILGLKFVELADMGAYYQLLTPGIPELGGWVYMGPYDTRGVLVRVHAASSRTRPRPTRTAAPDARRPRTSRTAGRCVRAEGSGRTPPRSAG